MAVGVLLINLGTPDAPEPAAVRRYLAEFLSDRRVVDLPPWLWQPILRGFVLRSRPQRSAELYAKIWMDEGSPLAVYTERQARALQQRLGSDAVVDYAMRYGNPGIAGALERLVAAGCDRILATPLYPQFSGATTGTAEDALAAACAAVQPKPELAVLPPYFDDPLYIGALRDSIERQLGALDFEPERLLLSFHGLPQRAVNRGDPYYDQCCATARLLAQALGTVPGQGLSPEDVDVAFQSRFGRAKWIGPATADRLAALPAEGVRRVAVAAPGFADDCLETLEELGIRGRSTFLAGGGEQFALLDCLNDSPEGMHMLEALVRRALAGWMERA